MPTASTSWSSKRIVKYRRWRHEDLKTKPTSWGPESFDVAPCKSPGGSWWGEKYGLNGPKILSNQAERATIWNIVPWRGAYSSMVSVSEFKPEDPGFDPLAGQGESYFLCPSESTLVQTLCLASLRHSLQFVRALNTPYLSVVKEKASQPVVWPVTQKHCIH